MITFTSNIATNNYTWTNGLNAPINGQYASLTFTNIGTWTVNAVNPISGCVSSKVFGLGQNTLTPTSTLTPAFQNITCSLTSITPVNSISSPSVNVSHVYYSPFGGSLTVLSYTSTYIPGGPGTYTDCSVNDVNGCSSCKEFTVAANQGFPTFSVTSPQSFTLGCTTKSVATINIIGASATNTNQIPTGGPVSYTLLSPTSSSATPSGTLSSLSSYTVNVPGTWTVVTKDNTSLCETRLAISVLQNTFAPDISVNYLQPVLSCDVPKVKLNGQSTTQNINYNWTFQGTPNNQPGDSITAYINSAAPNNTIVNNYTLTITDNSSTCKSTTIVPIYQNIYKPNVLIAVTGPSLTCNTTTIVLTNQSTTGIKGSFPTSSAVVAAYWEGPTPQEPLALSTTYVGSTPGVYTMTARDLNNGCINTGTVELFDNRKYPLLVVPTKKQIFACGENIDTVSIDITNRIAAMTFTWSGPPGVAMVDRNKVPLLTSSPGLYKLLVLNPLNGCATSAEVRFFNDSLTADFKIDREAGFAPMKVNFTNLTASNSDNSKISSFWNFSNGTFSTTTSAGISPITVYNAPGTYTVKLYGFKGNCNASVTHTIQVDLPSSLTIPNIFSPNGDNVNDVYFLKADNLGEISFTITDRWGHLVYELASHSGNVMWDGKNQAGQEMSEGVYFYTLKATGNDGQTYDQHGTITLTR
jgi:gliding motility-associated-like protein